MDKKLKPYPKKCPFCKSSKSLFWPWLNKNGGMGCASCDRPFVSDEGYEILGIDDKPIIVHGFFGGVRGYTTKYIYGERIYGQRQN